MNASCATSRASSAEPIIVASELKSRSWWRNTKSPKDSVCPSRHSEINCWSDLFTAAQPFGRACPRKSSQIPDGRTAITRLSGSDGSECRLGTRKVRRSLGEKVPVDQPRGQETEADPLRNRQR